MDEKTLATESFELIKKDLVLEAAVDFTNEPLKELHDFLTGQIQYLLDHDFSRLLNAMYRIDISEKKFKEILELAEPQKIAQILTSAIIKREKEKVITRTRHRF